MVVAPFDLRDKSFVGGDRLLVLARRDQLMMGVTAALLVVLCLCVRAWELNRTMHGPSTTGRDWSHWR